VVVGLAGAALVAMPGATAKAQLDRQRGAAITANGYSEAPSVSADGRFVAFDSEASNLVAGDTNDTWDVFVRDRRTKTTTLVSVSSSGTQGDAASSHPSISANGRFVVFTSVATNLVRGETSGSMAVYVRDLEAGTHVVFVRDTGIYAVGVDGRGLRAIVRVPVGEGDAAIDPRWSPDGKTIAYWTPNYDKPSLELIDATGHSPPRRLFQAAGNPIRPLWSRDSRSLLLTSDESGVWIVPVSPGSKPKRLATHTYEADWLG
jgi:Tol biopolymer transport system component